MGGQDVKLFGPANVISSRVLAGASAWPEPLASQLLAFCFWPFAFGLLLFAFCFRFLPSALGFLSSELIANGMTVKI